MNKQCQICHKIKSICKFYFRKDTKKYRNECKSCYNLNKKKYYNKNPWLQIWSWINTRCYNKNDKNYNKYGKKGIKNFLTKVNIKYLWCRDRAYLMKQPSIDRIDNNGHYELSNCEFIELGINSQKDKYKPILQLDLKRYLMKKWFSAKEVEEKLGISKSNICSVLKNKRINAGGFKWKYYNE